MPPQTAEVPADLLGEIGSLIEDYPPLDDQPARATAVAAALLSSIQHPDAPPQLAAALPEMVATLETNRAVPLLLRIAELGRKPAAEAASAALARLQATEASEHFRLR